MDDAEAHAFLDAYEQTIVEDASWAERNQNEFTTFTKPQEDWRSITGLRAIWRAANSLGKSFAQAADIVDCCRGTNRYRSVRRPPVKLLVVSFSWSQMDPLLEKLWQLLPKDEIDPVCYYEPGQGIKGHKEPVITFIAGPGKGSAIYFATYKQGANRIMGSQVHGVYLDEPPPLDVWGEVQPRLNAHGGFLRVSFTPTPESPDLEYLREEVAKGHTSNGRAGVQEFQTSLVSDATKAQGSQIVDIPRMADFEVERALDRYLDDEREMREHGAWFPLTKGRWVSTFTEQNVMDRRPPVGAFLCVSIDHGAQAGKQAAMLSAYENREDRDARVTWMAESQSDGATDSDDDVLAIIEMLAEAFPTLAQRADGKLTLESMRALYDCVDLWVGDRSLESNKRLVSKSNERLRKAFSVLLKRDLKDIAAIIVPYKYGNSVRDGAQLLKNLFKRRLADGLPAGIVWSRCVKFRDANMKFAGKKDDPCKDSWDAGRYGAESAIKGRRQIDPRFRF